MELVIGKFAGFCSISSQQPDFDDSSEHSAGDHTPESELSLMCKIVKAVQILHLLEW